MVRISEVVEGEVESVMTFSKCFCKMVDEHKWLFQVSKVIKFHGVKVGEEWRYQVLKMNSSELMAVRFVR